MAQPGQFILVTKADPKLVYCGPDTGWVPETPPQPPTPEEQAQGFATKEDADKYATQHGMSADVIQLP